ncbi:MFS transporter [Saccharophagus degradans]|uniref:MFS transporter n=1 Tax=Saccharophagus degradans TaxID=86304 RepID=UPI001C0857C7|nr:MFS transporter [Saccharophagus degradans]MBU2987677.1 MFS transporter [Saccharophagus degradans]
MLKIKQKIGYGLGDTASNIVFQAVANFMLIFYTDVFGLSAAAAGTVLGVVRLLDAVTDPIMGGIADRTRTKWGSYRPYLLWVAIPFALLAVLAFSTPSLSDGAKFIYALITYAAMMMAYTAINIPYAALGGVMTTNPRERASLQAYRFTFAMIGAMLVVWCIPKLVAHFGSGDDAHGYQIAMVIMGGVAVLCFVACFYYTTEKPSEQAATPKGNIAVDFLSLFKNDQWLIVAAISLCILILFALRISVAPHYVKYYLGQDAAFLANFLLLSNLGAVVAAVCTNYLSRSVEKKTLLLLGCIGLAIFGFVLGVLPAHSTLLIVACFVGTQYCQNVVVILMFSMVADTVDYGVEKTGKRVMGMTFSGHLLAIKAGFGIGGLSAGWLLGYYGFIANQTQTAHTLAGIANIFGTIPSYFAVLCAGLVLFYKLDTRSVEAIQARAKLNS